MFNALLINPIMRTYLLKCLIVGSGIQFLIFHYLFNMATQGLQFLQENIKCLE